MNHQIIEEEHDEAPNEYVITRRSALAGAFGAMLVPVNGLISSAYAQSSMKDAAGIGQVFDAIPDVCRVATATVEGPYYIDKEIVRSDIGEDQPGVPLEVELRIVSSNANCSPVKGAAVSIWHCNAEGEYSGYLFNDPNQMPDLATTNEFGHVKQEGVERFLRGVQTTDDDGRVKFQTIVPGWYTPRAVHIHVRVFLDEKTMIMTQLYFPQSLTGYIQSSVDAYKARGVSIYTNENDIVRRQTGVSGSEDIFKVTARDDGSLAAMATLGAGYM